MRDVMLAYQNNEAWNRLAPEEKHVLMHVAGVVVEQLSAAGEWVGDGLADASHPRGTRGRDGAVADTGGPPLEAKEALAGAGIVEVAIPARSEAIAARCPDAHHRAMEIPALTRSGREED